MAETIHRAAVALAAALMLILGVAGPAAAATPEERVLDGLDRIRDKHGLPALRESGPLGAAALRQSEIMLATDRFAHGSRLTAPGHWSLLGENIALEYGTRARPGWVLRAWMDSPVHRALILNGRFRYAGVGLSQGRFGGRRASAWTLRLGRRR